MTNEQNERLDGGQKEGKQTDAEFAADTWMGAVFQPKATRSNGNNAPDTQAAQTNADPSPASSLGVPAGNDVLDTSRQANVVRDTKYETGSEIASPLRRADKPRWPVGGSALDRQDSAAGNLGMVALGLSILSLFLLPYLLAPVGMVLGYLALRRNARTMGTWAMIIGAVAILGAILIYPYFVAR